MASRYFVGGNILAPTDWNALLPTNWATTSGGAGGASVPGSTDDVFLDANSPSNALAANISIKSLDCTGFVNTFTHQAGVLITIAGDLFKLASGMTYTLINATNSALSFTSTTGTQGTPTAITLGGKTVGDITLNGAGGYFTLQDAFNSGVTATITLTAGTFDAGNQSITAGLFSSSNANTRVITMGSGNWTLGGTGTVWNTATTTNLTVNANTSTIVINDTSATGKTFSGGGMTFGSITFSGDNITVAGANTFYNFTINNAGLTNGLKLTSAVTQTITGLITNNGTTGNLTKLLATTGGSAATISMASGVAGLDYMSIQDSTATGGANFYAGANSTNVSGNTGWVFSSHLVVVAGFQYFFEEE